MKKTALMAMAAVVLMGGVGCNRSNNSGPETALDRAYHAGILSKDEYQAKKAAVLAPATAPVASAPVASATVAAPVPVAPAPAKAPVSAPVHPLVAAMPPAAQPAAVPAPVVEAPAPVAPAVTPERIAAAPVRPAPAARDEERESIPPAACEDSEVRPGKEKGKQERFYPLPPSKVRAALLQSLNDLEFQIHTATDTEIEAGKKRHIGVLVGHGGERITLRLEEATEGRQRGTRVTGETKKSFVMRAGQKSWTNAILDQAACALHTSGRAARFENPKGTRQSTY